MVQVLDPVKQLIICFKLLVKISQLNQGNLLSLVELLELSSRSFNMLSCNNVGVDETICRYLKPKPQIERNKLLA